MLNLTALMVSMMVTIAVMPFFRFIACKMHALDTPNARKIHNSVIPKCGGMAMAVGLMTPLFLWGPWTQFSKAVIVGSIILVVIGVVDDIKDLGFRDKFIGQIGAATIAVMAGGIKISSLGSLLPSEVILPDLIAIPMTIFVIVGVTNATNLSDGLDGLAGGIALLIFTCIGYFGLVKGDTTVVLFSVAVIGAILGFLRFNSHPAQLFMGDAGSQLLGYLAIVLSIKLTQTAGGLSVVLPLFIIGLPIADTLTVMTKRLAQGKPPFVADKKHFHHQLIGMGLYHSEAVLSIYIIQSLYIIFALTLQKLSDWYLIILYLVYSIAIVAFFNFVERTGFQTNRQGFLNPINERLRVIKDRGVIIKYCFQIVKISVPSLFILNCLIPTTKFESYYILALGFMILTILAWLFKNDLVDQVTKLGLYVVTPFVVYAGDQGIYEYLGKTFSIIYNIAFAVLFVFLMITLNFTRRKTRFKSTPLDFLVVFILFFIFSMPNAINIDYQMGLVSVKTLILFYGYEILVGELRQRTNKMTMASSMLLMIAGLKGLISVGHFL